MRITEVRMKLLRRGNGAEKLRAFCTVTLDDKFVIRDLKIIEGAKGAFIAMPSRKLTDRCGKCGHKNHLRARYCNECGGALRRHRAARDDRGRARLYVDIAHPINVGARRLLHDRVMETFKVEEEKAARGDYEFASYDDEAIDYGYEYDDTLDDVEVEKPRRRDVAAGTDRPPVLSDDEPSTRSDEAGGFGAGL